MKHKYYLILLVTLALASCKKSNDAPVYKQPDSASLALEQQLEAGEGTWKVVSVKDVWYDSDNKAVYSLDASTNTPYWVFSPIWYTPWTGSFTVHQFATPDQTSYQEAAGYTFIFSGGKQYFLLSGVQLQIVNLTTTQLIILETDKDLNYPTGPNSFGKADHGITSTTFEKYK